MLAFTIILTLVFYSFACLGLGWLVLRVITNKFNWIDRSSAGTKLASSFLLGQGFLANLWLLLALKGWLSPVVVVGIVLIFALCGVFLSWRQIIDFSYQVRSMWRDLWAESWGWKILALLTLCLCLLWITSLGRRLSWDGGAFNMALPKVVAATYQLRPLPGIYEEFTSIGLQAEMHFAALMSLGNPDAARLFDWPTILAGGVMLLALGRQVGLKRRGQWITFTMLFSSSAIIWLSGFGKTDLFAAALGLAAFYWALQLRYSQRHVTFWLVGLFSGFAIVAKITYILAMAPGIVIIIAWTYLDDFRPPKKEYRTVAILLQGMLHFLAGFLLAIAPHLIKNGILFHNPIAPFGADAPNWLDLPWHGPNTTRHILLTYPLAITFGNYYGQTGNLSPLVLAFLPLTLLLPRPKFIKASHLIAVSLAALSCVLIWTVVRPVLFAPRYMLASLSLLFLPAARAAEYVSMNERKPRLLKTGIMACIGITIIIIGLAYHNFAYFPLTTYQYLGGKLPECARDIQNCEPMTILNKRVPLGTRLFTNSYQRYWLRPDLIQCLLTYDEIQYYLTLQSDKDQWNFIYAHGFRYLIVFDDVGFVFQDIPIPRLEQIPHWLSVTSEQIGSNVILRLQSQDFSHETGFDCYQQDDRIWTATSPLYDSR